MLGLPETIYVGLMLGGLVITATRHRDHPVMLLSAYFAAMINIGLLYWGGFFD